MGATIEAPRAVVESFATLRLPEWADRRLQTLMDRNNEGDLTADEKEEFKSLVDWSHTISLMRADALLILGRRP